MLHNLLPPIEKRAIHIEYLMRLGTVGVFLGIIVLVIGIGSLVPAYVGLHSEIEAISLVVGDASGVMMDVGFGTSSDQVIVAETASMIALFQSTLEEHSVTEIVRTALSVRPDEVSVEGITYLQDEKSVSVEGVAKTRDVLVEYARALEETTLFGRVPVSISDLAKNTNIHFRLSFDLEQTEKSP